MPVNETEETGFPSRRAPCLAYPDATRSRDALNGHNQVVGQVWLLLQPDLDADAGCCGHIGLPVLVKVFDYHDVA